MRSVCVAMLLAISVTLAHAQRIEEPAASTEAAEPVQRPRTGYFGQGLPPPPADARYVVQVTAQRSEEDARKSIDLLQARYPAALGGHPFVIRRVEIGSKGPVFYRGQFGPFVTLEAANAFCAALKDAGGQCILQRYD